MDAEFAKLNKRRKRRNESEAEAEVEPVKAPKAPKAEAKPMVHLMAMAGAATGFRPRG